MGDLLRLFVCPDRSGADIRVSPRHACSGGTSWVSADLIFPKDVLILYLNSQLLSFAEGASHDPDRVPAGEVRDSAPKDFLLYHKKCN